MNHCVASSRIHVVAAVLRDGRGRVLLAQRPTGKDWAGAWEFPGGKVEVGESAQQALVRELREELGIDAQIGRRRMAVPDERIVLDVYEVYGFSGTPRGHEGQELIWLEPTRINSAFLPPVDRPVLSSLQLPELYLITPTPASGGDASFLAALEMALQQGVTLVQLRAPGWSRKELANLARQAHALCRQAGARLLLNADYPLAAVLGLDGAHLPARMAATLHQRPLPSDKLVGVSCHTIAELNQASAIGADYATLSPIQATPSHPQTSPLGWEQAEAWVAGSRLPVYALGGLSANELPVAFAHGFQGIAAIRAFWPNPVA